VLNPVKPNLQVKNSIESVKESTINLPIKIDIHPFEELINNQIKNDLLYKSGIHVGNGISLQLDVKRDGKINLNTTDGRINTQIPIYIKGRAEWKEEVRIKKNMGLFKVNWDVGTISHHEDIEARVTISTSTILKIDENWNIIAETNSDFNLNQAPSIQILGFNISFASIAKDNIRKQLPAINNLIDTEAKKLYNLRREAEKYWKELETPLLLIEKPVKIWAILEPSHFNFAPPKSLNINTLELNLALNTKINTYIGNEPPLPNLGNLVPVSNAETNRSDFNINLPVVIALTELEKVAQKELVDQIYPIPNTNRKVLIKQVEIYGVGESLVFKVNIKSKKTKGNVFLIGKLHYNSETQELSVKDLVFDTKTNKVLINKASWLINEIFIKTVEKKLVYNTASDLQKAKKIAEQAINEIKLNELMTLHGHINEFKVNHLYTETDVIKLISCIRGNIRMDINE